MEDLGRGGGRTLREPFVSDWERSNAFYRAVVGAEVVELARGLFAYRFGEQHLSVHGPGSTPRPSLRSDVSPGASHICFVWPGPIEEALAHLEEQGIEIEEGPVARICARGVAQSVYFRDPDGNLLELISYDASR